MKHLKDLTVMFKGQKSELSVYTDDQERIYVDLKDVETGEVKQAAMFD